MSPYADTNFLTRLYLDADESNKVLGLANQIGRRDVDALPVTWLHQLELCNALQLHVFQGRTPGQLRVTAEQAAIAWAAFCEEQHSPSRFRPAPISHAEITAKVEDLSLRHTARHGFRTYDLIHVASALLLECDTFWSFDVKAAKLASLEGLKAPSLQR